MLLRHYSIYKPMICALVHVRMTLRSIPITVLLTCFACVYVSLATFVSGSQNYNHDDVQYTWPNHCIHVHAHYKMRK